MVEQLVAIFTQHPPAAVMVRGDTNTASAAAQAGNYAGGLVVRVEAGLCSHDRTMSEERNRRIIGVLADIQCAPTQQAVQDLRHEGVSDARLPLTGSTIVEATQAMVPDDGPAGPSRPTWVSSTGQIRFPHHPSSAEHGRPAKLQAILDELGKLGLPAPFPLHPRTGPPPGTASLPCRAGARQLHGADRGHRPGVCTPGTARARHRRPRTAADQTPHPGRAPRNHAPCPLETPGPANG